MRKRTAHQVPISDLITQIKQSKSDELPNETLQASNFYPDSVIPTQEHSEIDSDLNSAATSDGCPAFELVRHSVSLQDLQNELLEKTTSVYQSEEKTLNLPQPETLNSNNNKNSLRVVCFRTHEWMFGLMATAHSEFDEIRQNGRCLKQDGNIWSLEDLSTPIELIAHETPPTSLHLEIDSSNPIIFKLSVSGNTGRHVRAMTEGEFLVLAPQQWRRAISVAGDAYFDSENITTIDMRAHYFHIDKTSPPAALETEDGTTIFLSQHEERFELTGYAIDDAIGQEAPLFAKNFPKVIFTSKTPIELHSYLELNHKDGVKIKMLCQSRLTSLDAFDFNTLISNPRSGYYQIKLKTSKGEELQSQHFRLCTGLFNISSNLLRSSQTDQSNICFNVEHAQTASIAIATSSSTKFQAYCAGTKTSISSLGLEPVSYVDLEYEDTSKAKVGLKLLLESIWWKIALDSETTAWSRTATKISSTYLKPTSQARLIIRLPKSRWIDCVFA